MLGILCLYGRSYCLEWSVRLPIERHATSRSVSTSTWTRQSRVGATIYRHSRHPELRVNPDNRRRSRGQDGAKEGDSGFR